ncbi:MAG: helix-turn-helix transcriptional regulator [Bacteroidales bacterium]|nr:helix-turn-helix transcriptional regulator [Bacteroidales bacterium]
MDFTVRLKELRKRKGTSQGNLTKLIKVHFTQESHYERGETKPNAEAMSKLAKALDTTVDYLMNGAADDVEKKTVLSLMDAYIAKTKVQTLLHVK